LAKASLEGFNLTYKELNEQQEIETNKRFQLEAEIALEDAALEKEKVGFIEKNEPYKVCNMSLMICCKILEQKKTIKT
jgi:hypothetical protein